MSNIPIICVKLNSVSSVSSNSKEIIDFQPGDLIRVYFELNKKYLIKSKENTFIVNTENFDVINEKMWEFLIAIKNPDDRLKAMDIGDVLIDIKINQKIPISFIIDKREKKITSGCVEYIGEVPEIGDGNFFGIRILNNNFEIPFNPYETFLSKYTSDPNKFIIISAEYIFKPFPLTTVNANLQEPITPNLLLDEVNHSISDDTEHTEQQDNQNYLENDFDDNNQTEDENIDEFNDGAKAQYDVKLEVNINDTKRLCRLCNCMGNSGMTLTLSKCNHTFCQPCLLEVIQRSDGPVPCPYIYNGMPNCLEILTDDEISAIIEISFPSIKPTTKSDDYFDKCMDVFECKNFNCNGCWIPEGGSNLYACPVCKVYNCIKCNVIHLGITCDDYKFKNDNKWSISSITTAIETRAKTLGRKVMDSITIPSGDNEIKPQKNEWICKNCSVENDDKFINCELCSKPRSLY